MKLVVDTNIVFSALLNTNSRIAEILTRESNVVFYSPTFLLFELDKHQDKLFKMLKLHPEEIIQLKHLATQRIHFVQEEQIAARNWLLAEQLTSQVDGDDIPFVALALELQCPLWTGDKRLHKGIQRIDILTTEQVAEIKTK